MANYLARVAANGAASQPLARPSLVAPPILPGRALAPDPEPPIAQRSAPLLSAANLASAGEVRAEGPQSDRPTGLTSTAVTQPGGAMPPADPPDRRSHPEPTPPISGVPGPPRPELTRPADSNVVRAPRLQPAAPPEEMPRHFDFRPEPVAIVHLPRSLGRAQSAALGEEFVTAAPEIERTPAQMTATPARAPDPVMPALAMTARREHSGSEPERDRGAPVDRRIISVPQVRTGNVVVEMPNAGSSRREPKITIGQIDVQVINTPAVAPPQPASTPSTSNVTNVELERVRWRLL